MDSEDPIASTFVHDVDGTESAVDETTPQDTVFPGVGVALGDSAAPQDLVLPPSRAARLSTEPSGNSGRPESFMIHGGLRFGFLIGWAVGALVVVAIVDGTDSWGADRRLNWLVLGGVALVSLYATYRVFRRGVGADPAGVPWSTSLARNASRGKTSARSRTAGIPRPATRSGTHSSSS